MPLYPAWDTTNYYIRTGSISFFNTFTTNDTVEGDNAPPSHSWGTRTDNGVGEGKIYFEIHHPTGNSGGAIGIATSTTDPTTGPSNSATTVDRFFWGNTSNAWSVAIGLHNDDLYLMHGTGGDPVTNGTFVGTVANRLLWKFMCCIDINAGYAWFGFDGTWLASGNPAAGTNPTFTGVIGDTDNLLYAVASGIANTPTSNIVCDPLNMAYGPPTGFTTGQWGIPLGYVRQTFTKPTQALAALADFPDDEYYSWFKDKNRA